ncbi:unnamed protein product [Merluccius merluccius]
MYSTALVFSRVDMMSGRQLDENRHLLSNAKHCSTDQVAARWGWLWALEMKQAPVLQTNTALHFGPCVQLVGMPREAQGFTEPNAAVLQFLNVQTSENAGPTSFFTSRLMWGKTY